VGAFGTAKLRPEPNITSPGRTELVCV